MSCPVPVGYRPANGLGVVTATSSQYSILSRGVSFVYEEQAWFRKSLGFLVGVQNIEHQAPKSEICVGDSRQVSWFICFVAPAISKIAKTAQKASVFITALCKQTSIVPKTKNMKTSCAFWKKKGLWFPRVFVSFSCAIFLGQICVLALDHNSWNRLKTRAKQIRASWCVFDAEVLTKEAFRRLTNNTFYYLVSEFSGLSSNHYFVVFGVFGVTWFSRLLFRFWAHDASKHWWYLWAFMFMGW